MDIETVADLLSVSSRQIRTYITAGLPAGRDGRKPVFRWPEVLDWYVGYKSAIEYGERPLASADDADLDDEALPEDDAAQGKKEDIRSASLRKTRADADLKELALSRERAEVITIADARSRLDRLFGNLRSQLLGMPPKLATRLAGIPEPTAMESVIKEEMETLCRDLATGAVVGTIPQEVYPAGDISIAASADNGLTDRQLRRAARRIERAYAAE